MGRGWSLRVLVACVEFVSCARQLFQLPSVDSFSIFYVSAQSCCLNAVVSTEVVAFCGPQQSNIRWCAPAAPDAGQNVDKLGVVLTMDLMKFDASCHGLLPGAGFKAVLFRIVAFGHWRQLPERESAP
jgi:hypothetical protein